MPGVLCAVWASQYKTDMDILELVQQRDVEMLSNGSVCPNSEAVRAGTVSPGEQAQGSLIHACVSNGRV